MTPRHLLAIAARGVAAVFEVVKDGYDASPLATHALADRARDAHWLRAEKVAMADPEYAAIQARANDGSSDSGPLLNTSKGRKIGWDDFETQLRISDEPTPTPFWWPLASFIADRPMRRLAGSVEAAYQRATRGWADSDRWDLGINLCATLAGQLNHLADAAWGWPGPPDYPGPEDWTAALRTAATGLNGWATHGRHPATETAPSAVQMTGEADRAAAEVELPDDEVLLADAQNALRWVADNLRDLWD
jgi:hypothetical protein